MLLTIPLENISSEKIAFLSTAYSSLSVYYISALLFCDWPTQTCCALIGQLTELALYYLTTYSIPTAYCQLVNSKSKSKSKSNQSQSQVQDPKLQFFKVLILSSFGLLLTLLSRLYPMPHHPTPPTLNFQRSFHQVLYLFGNLLKPLTWILPHFIIMMIQTPLRIVNITQDCICRTLSQIKSYFDFSNYLHFLRNVHITQTTVHLSQGEVHISQG